jgi:3',5'-cyclic AMP phosphodiesterase CpdA
VRLLAHLSDLHFGRHDEAIAEALLASLADTRPHLVVVSGDLTQRARRDEFAAARKFLDRLSAIAPVLVVPGNHDVPLYNVFRRFLRPLTRYARYISADRLPRFADQEMVVLGLNTARARALTNGRVSREQMDDIWAAFAHHRQTCWKILVTHHPLAAPVGGARRAEPVGRAAAALDAVAAAGGHVLLSGHFHHATSGEAALPVAGRRSLMLAHAGTAISTRTREEENSFNLLRLDGDRLVVTVFAWQSAAFVPLAPRAWRLEQHHWVADDLPPPPAGEMIQSVTGRGTR